MSILSDSEIAKLCRSEPGMIRPFFESRSPSGCISYGLSSFGYDIRLGSKFLVFDGNRLDSAFFDPKSVKSDCFVEKVSLEPVIVPPNSFILAESVEYFNIPRDVLAICLGKSTYARCGIIVNVTPLEPEWKGRLTIEISNSANVASKIYPHEGIAQLVFFKASQPCVQSYFDKVGKYQDQQGVVPARI